MGQAKKPAAKPETAKKAPRAARGTKKTDPQVLIEKAYKDVDKRLQKKEGSKAIEDLVKLVKLGKDLGGEEKDVKEVTVRWEKSKDESSHEQ